VDRVGAIVHGIVKEVNSGVPATVREVKIRKGSRWRCMRSDCTERNEKSWSGPRERC
jgi:hypothetical protein